MKASKPVIKEPPFEMDFSFFPSAPQPYQFFGFDQAPGSSQPQSGALGDVALSVGTGDDPYSLLCSDMVPDRWSRMAIILRSPRFSMTFIMTPQHFWHQRISRPLGLLRLKPLTGHCLR